MSEPTDQPREHGEHEHDPQGKHQDLLSTDPNAGSADGLAGGMGVSSERVGPTGSGHGTHGAYDTSRLDVPDEEAPPEQRPGAEEPNSSIEHPKDHGPHTD